MGEVEVEIPARSASVALTQLGHRAHPFVEETT